MRKVAFVVLFVGAIGSLGLMLNAGRHTPLFLLVLFVGWVLSPYIMLLLVNIVSKRWPIIIPVTLYWLMIFISVGSLVTYFIILRRHSTKPAFIFLVVPFISWILIGIVILATVYRTRKLSKKDESF